MKEKKSKSAKQSALKSTEKGAAEKQVKGEIDHCGSVAQELLRHLNLSLGADQADGSHHYLYQALASTVRDQLLVKWRESRRNQSPEGNRVSYLSLEYLMGRSLHNAVLNLDIDRDIVAALSSYACSLEDLESEELDAGLGNGGLGRLAACFLDSCASMDIPVIGYGLRYHYGMFHQLIKNGYQVESPDFWLRHGNPWEVEVPENTRHVSFRGYSEHYLSETGEPRVRWVDTEDVVAIPYDMPVPGFRNGRVNTLRLWKAEATDEFNLAEFNAGDYADAVAKKNQAEQITMVLYPNDQSVQGKALRLRQQYFLVSASLQDVLDAWCSVHDSDFSDFADNHVFQLNDTHPAIAVAELMRLLMDCNGLGWDEAWSITTTTMAYTNHTLLPEALETWSVELFSELLPRPMEIIYEINARFLTLVAGRWPGDVERQRQLSIIAEEGQRHIRMAHLAIVGSYSVNGVAALHTELLSKGLFQCFYELWPEKFNNKTNGVTPRRWLHHCNPGLRDLLNATLGEGWINNLDQLKQLEPFAEDNEFKQQFHRIKQENKARLAALVERRCGVEFDNTMMFDVQVKRIHEYKRQLLNILHVIHLYDRILCGDTHSLQPRCVLIGGKAAPGYFVAKQIIKLINSVASVINCDERARDYLRVAFFPDYGVSAMEIICPGTDLSEQISTAGKEASGTGNMKFMMNGAVTIGTLDGANIEILEAVGADNFFLFGMNAEEVSAELAGYDPQHIIAHDPDLQRVMSLLESGHFNLFEPGVFDPLIACIRSTTDPWMVAADFRSYVNAQQQAGEAFRDEAGWIRKSIMNTARSGYFSSDRTIAEYRDDIWFANKR